MSTPTRTVYFLYARRCAARMSVAMAAFIMLSSANVHAATLPAPGVTVFVQDVRLDQAQVKPGEVVAGTFVLSNPGLTNVDNVYVSIALASGYSTDGLAGSLYRQQAIGPLTLKPQEQQHQSFRYQLPQSVTGKNFGIHVQSRVNGNDLGWGDALLTVNGATNGLTLETTQLIFEGKKYALNIEPIAKKEETIEFVVTVKNNNIQSLSLTPMVQITDHDTPVTVLFERTDTPQLIQPNVSTVVTVAIPIVASASSKADVAVYFRDTRGQDVAASSQFRYRNAVVASQREGDLKESTAIPLAPPSSTPAEPMSVNGVGLALGIIILIGIVWGFLRARRKKRGTGTLVGLLFAVVLLSAGSTAYAYDSYWDSARCRQIALSLGAEYGTYCNSDTNANLHDYSLFVNQPNVDVPVAGTFMVQGTYSIDNLTVNSQQLDLTVIVVDKNNAEIVRYTKSWPYTGVAGNANSIVVGGAFSFGPVTVPAVGGPVQVYFDPRMTNNPISSLSKPRDSIHVILNGLVPSAPTLAPAQSGDGIINLGWTQPSGYLRGYKIYRAQPSGVTASSLLLNNNWYGTSYTDQTATNGTPFSYRVVAFNGAGDSLLSNEVSGTARSLIQAPHAPTITSLTPGDLRVRVDWSPPAETVSGYSLYRSRDPIADTLPAVIRVCSDSVGELCNMLQDVSPSHPVNSSYFERRIVTYTDNTTLINRKRYYYRIATFNDSGVSPLSNQMSAIPISSVVPPLTPQLVSTVGGNAKVVLTWNPWSGPTSFFDEYIVYRVPAPTAIADQPPYRLPRCRDTGDTLCTIELIADPSRTTFADTYGIINGVSYTYRMKATNEGGESDLSGSKTGITSAAATITSIVIAPKNIAIDLATSNHQQAYTVTAQMSDGTQQTLTASQITWSINASGQTIAHLSAPNSGTVVADTVGIATVSAVLTGNASIADFATMTVSSSSVSGYAGSFAVTTSYIPSLPPVVTCMAPNATSGIPLTDVQLTWCNGSLNVSRVCVPVTEPNQQQYRWQYQLKDAGVSIVASAGFTEPGSINPRQREVAYTGNLISKHPYEWNIRIQNQAGEQSPVSTCSFITQGKPNLRIARNVTAGNHVHIIVRPDALQPSSETTVDGQSLAQTLSQQLPSAANPIIIGMPMEVEVGVENNGNEDAPGYWVDLYSEYPESAIQTTDWLTSRNPVGVFSPHRFGEVKTTSAPFRFKASNLATALDTVLFATEEGGTKFLWAYADSSPTLPTLNNGNGNVMESNESDNASVINVAALEKFKFAFAVEYAPVGSSTFSPVPPRIAVNQGDTIQLKVKISSDVSKFKPGVGAVATMQSPRPVTLTVAAAPSNTAITTPPSGALPVSVSVSQTTGLAEQIITIKTFKCPITLPNCSTATPSGFSLISITGQTGLPAWDQFTAPSVPITLDIKLITASDLVVTACEAKIGSQQNESTRTATLNTIIVNKGTDVQLSMSAKNKGMVPTDRTVAVSMTRDAPEPGLGGVNATQLGTADIPSPMAVNAEQVFSSFSMPTNTLEERTYPIYAQVDINNAQIEQAESNNVGKDGRQQPCGYVVVTAPSAPTSPASYYLQFTSSWPWGLVKQLFWGSTEVGLFPDQVVTDVTGPTSESTNYQLKQLGVIPSQTDKLPPSTTNVWKAQLSDSQIEQDAGGQIQAFCIKDSSGHWSVSTDGIPKAILDKSDDLPTDQTTSVSIPPGERMSVLRSFARLGAPTSVVVGTSTVPLRNELFFVEQQDTAVTAQAITIANDLPSALAWTISAPSKPDWFTLSAISGTAPANGISTISVGISNDATSASPQTRTYEFTVTHGIAGNNACTTSIPVRVTYVITPIDPNVEFSVSTDVTSNSCRVVRDTAGRMVIKAPIAGFQVVSITSKTRSATSALHYQPQLMKEDESAASDLFEFVNVDHPEQRSSSLPAREIRESGPAGTQKIGIRIKDNLPGRVADYTAKLKIATNANLPGGSTELSGDAQDITISCNINTTPTFRNVTPSPKSSGSTCSSVPLLSTMNRTGRRVYTSATPKNPSFFWDFNDTDKDALEASETQGAFKIMIKDCSTNAIVFDPVIPGSATSCEYGSSCGAGASTLRWNTSYDWYLQVQDSRVGNTAASGELDPALTANSGFAYAGSFLTDPHHPPDVDFTWKGEKTKSFVLAGSQVEFAANQETLGDVHRVMCYTDSAPDTAKQCYDVTTLDPELNPTYEWYFGDDEGPDVLQADVAIIVNGVTTTTRGKHGKRCTIRGSAVPNSTDSDCANPKHSYKDIGLYTISLWVNDGVGGPSSRSNVSNFSQKPIKVISPLFKRELPQ